MRLDKIPAGSAVELVFDANHDNTEKAIFLGISGEGNDRRAKFMQKDCVRGHVYDWEAYRYNGSWAYGSSAGRLQVVDYQEVL